MDEEPITHQESLVSDSFSTLERLESEMATITREFESLDSGTATEVRSLPLSHAGDVRSEATEPLSLDSEKSTSPVAQENQAISDSTSSGDE
ncbi:MAG TPA: hypothetical protein PKB15_04470 [Acidimicrobiia bacterium]|nr:hypothetical protein [Acidimicrobiia bacterium]